MVDLYTKLMLTIIAAATVLIAFQMWAKNQSYASACGHPKMPCYIDTASGDWLAVRVIPPNQGAP